MSSTSETRLPWMWQQERSYLSTRVGAVLTLQKSSLEASQCPATVGRLVLADGALELTGGAASRPGKPQLKPRASRTLERDPASMQVQDSNKAGGDTRAAPVFVAKQGMRYMARSRFRATLSQNGVHHDTQKPRQ